LIGLAGSGYCTWEVVEFDDFESLNWGFGTDPVEEGLAEYMEALLALAMKGRGLAWTFAENSGAAGGVGKIL